MGQPLVGSVQKITQELTKKFWTQHQEEKFPTGSAPVHYV